MSILASIICKKRSIPVMPRWNCSANSMILRIVAINVVTYSIYATRSPGRIMPLTIKIPPATTTARYITPSNILVVVWNAPIYLYVSFLIPKKLWLSPSNFWFSISSFVKAFTTFWPSKVSSIRAFNSPIWYRCAANAFFILRFSFIQDRTITGTITKIISVSHRLIIARIAKPAMPLIAAIKNSSGQWCANSVTSNKSLVIRPIIWPTFVLL